MGSLFKSFNFGYSIALFYIQYTHCNRFINEVVGLCLNFVMYEHTNSTLNIWLVQFVHQKMKSNAFNLWLFYMLEQKSREKKVRVFFFSVLFMWTNTFDTSNTWTLIFPVNRSSINITDMVNLTVQFMVTCH